MDTRHLLWIPAAGVVSGATSFVFGDLVTMPVDLYYLIYFVVVLGFFTVYVRTANPAASVISHAVMHLSAVVHSPASDLYLPPHRE